MEPVSLEGERGKEEEKGRQKQRCSWRGKSRDEGIQLPVTPMKPLTASAKQASPQWGARDWTATALARWSLRGPCDPAGRCAACSPKTSRPCKMCGKLSEAGSNNSQHGPGFRGAVPAPGINPSVAIAVQRDIILGVWGAALSRGRAASRGQRPCSKPLISTPVLLLTSVLPGPCGTCGAGTGHSVTMHHAWS